MDLGVNSVTVRKAVNLPVRLRKVCQNAGGYYKSKCKRESTNPFGILISDILSSLVSQFGVWKHGPSQVRES